MLVITSSDSVLSHDHNIDDNVFFVHHENAGKRIRERTLYFKLQLQDHGNKIEDTTLKLEEHQTIITHRGNIFHY